VTHESEAEDSEFPLSGNKTRDQVRKLLFEIFKPDIDNEDDGPRSQKNVGNLIASIESGVFDECKEDARSKAFRDKIKTI
jgi:hypothetical protein